MKLILKEGTGVKYEDTKENLPVEIQTNFQ
jgi:hypothetical protein